MPPNHHILTTCPQCSHTFNVDVTREDLIQPNDPSEPQYDLRDLERILGLSRVTLKRAIYGKRLHATKLGDGPTTPWFVSESELRRFRRARDTEKLLKRR